MPVIDVWAAIADRELPDDVLLRLLARRNAREKGETPEPCPEADKPFLARHIVPAPSVSVAPSAPSGAAQRPV